VILPRSLPALLTGFALAFARAVGEYGSVIFIAGNMPMVSEITPLLIITKLEQYDYAGATAIAAVMLVASFVLLLAINAAAGVERRKRRLSRERSRTGAATPRPPPRATSRRAGEPRWVLLGADRARAAVPRAVPAVPLVAVFVEALREGLGAYLAAITEPDALAAIRLTLLVAAIAVPLNLSSASPPPGRSPSSSSAARAC
jgi:ABC-type sulfate transport system permease component